MNETVFESDAQYQQVVNIWAGEPVHLRLDSENNFSVVSKATNSLILTVQLTAIERLEDYSNAIIIMVAGKKYKFNFDRIVSPVKSLFFGGIYNWIAPTINNPLAGVKKQWIDVFAQHGVKPYRIKAGRSIVAGILVSSILVVLIFVIMAYVTSL